MINNRIIILMVSTVLLASCSGRIVHMENEQGARIKCEVSMGSAMMTGILVRDSAIENCVRDKESAGFKVVGEK